MINLNHPIQTGDVQPGLLTAAPAEQVRGFLGQTHTLILRHRVEATQELIDALPVRLPAHRRNLYCVNAAVITDEIGQHKTPLSL